ncbi:hypothetical protein ASPCADRAFT_205572, partial [Aspergillus carbonarius ITEM 5010]
MQMAWHGLKAGHVAGGSCVLLNETKYRSPDEDTFIPLRSSYVELTVPSRYYCLPSS